MSSNLIGQTLYRRYRVEQFLGSGGMGVVYKVWDTRANVHLAAKVLNSDLIDDEGIRGKFKREANALKKLQHPHILRFFGYFESGDSPFLVMQYIDGLSLKELLKSSPNRRMPVEEALVYLKAVSAALGYAHAYGVVHCDVKPGNVMVDRGGGIYLADFGIARHADSTVTTRLGGLTTAYASPEQCRLEKVLTPASDVYSLAVMFYEMVAGRRPFELKDAGTESGVLNTGEYLSHAHRQSAPPDPRQFNPALPEALAGVILRGLEKDPADRFAGTRDFFDAACAAVGIDPDALLDRAPLSPRIQEQMPSPEPVPAVAAAGPTGEVDIPGMIKRNPVMVYGGIGLVVVVVALLLMSGGGRRDVPAVQSPPTAAVMIVPGDEDQSEPSSGSMEATPLPTDIPPTSTTAPTEEPSVTPTLEMVPGPIEQRALAGVTANSQWTPFFHDFDGVTMALVPAGCFTMGNTINGARAAYDLCLIYYGESRCFWELFEDEVPAHPQCFNEPFWIDVTEVTRAQMGGSGIMPRSLVNWFDAAAYCESRGGRLPTEAEWEYAARGPDGWIYPWGNVFNGTRLNYCDINCRFDWRDMAYNDGEAEIEYVGIYPQGASWVGALDMSGNLWEWVSSIYRPYPYSPADGREASAAQDSTSRRVMRGGGWTSGPDNVRAVNRGSDPPRTEDDLSGFRCARSY